jgi:CRISPR-associated protein Cas1
MNAVLSFLYTLLRTDCEAAIQAVGLDPQVGYLHALRPGRPALALDLMEELRAVLADRLALSLVNRRQVQPNDFTEGLAGAVYLTNDARGRVIRAYQERKAEEVAHRLLGRNVPLGLVPHVQARLLARYLRGDLDGYPTFTYG